MLLGFLILIGSQLAGEIISTALDLPIPGAVLGMIMLFIALIVKKGIPESLENAANGLLKHIGLLFVPAGAGISMFIPLIIKEWDVILIASVGSTVITLLICGGLYQIWQKDK